jgi:hypothetical protein
LQRKTRTQTSRTLDLSQDESGLYFRSNLDPNDPDVQRIAPKMERGDLTEMSFAFSVVEDEWSEDYQSRTLRALNLDGGDVSIVTYPANPNALVSMRSKMLASAGPEKLRMVYRSLVEGGDPKAGLSPQLRSLLEDLTVEDETAEVTFTALTELVNAPAEVRSDDDEEAERKRAALENELRRMRLEILKLK